MECHGGMIVTGKTGEKPVPLPLCPPQKQHGLKIKVTYCLKCLFNTPSWIVFLAKFLFQLLLKITAVALFLFSLFVLFSLLAPSYSSF
jgi:hypothetical protein